MSDSTTPSIRIETRPEYVPERSDQEHNYFFFAYHITIANVGNAPAKLLSRHWIITDGMGVVQEVKGPGVVGEQPYLQSGESFEYTSFCPLPTPVGTMQGSFQMRRDDGSMFDAVIAPFTLAIPEIFN